MGETILRGGLSLTLEVAGVTLPLNLLPGKILTVLWSIQDQASREVGRPATTKSTQEPGCQNTTRLSSHLTFLRLKTSDRPRSSSSSVSTPTRPPSRSWRQRLLSTCLSRSFPAVSSPPPFLCAGSKTAPTPPAMKSFSR